MLLAPSQILTLHLQNKPAHFKTDSLKDIFITGVPILTEQILEIRKAFPNTRVTVAYGQTETVGIIACFKPNNPKEIDGIRYKPTSSGSGLPGMTFKVHFIYQNYKTVKYIISRWFTLKQKNC